MSLLVILASQGEEEPPEEYTSEVSLGGVGTLSADSTRESPPPLTMTVLDESLYYAPTVVTVVVENGIPGASVTFTIDGQAAYTETLDSTGAIGPVSVPVGEQYLAGPHIITANVDGAIPVSGMFSLYNDPHPNPRVVGPDADPLDVPASHTATGVHRWVLQDLLPGGLGSWVLPRNPQSCQPFPNKRTLNQSGSTYPGRYRFTEPGIEAHPWSFSGWVRTKDEQDKLLAYASLKRRFYLIDHRGRAWTVVFTSADIRARKRIADDDGTFNDWTADYTIQALIHGTDWKVPQ